MDDAARTADFTDYVKAREQALARLAYLLTGDRDAAEDLLQNALAKCYRNWERVRGVEQPDAYVRRILINERNSRWRRIVRRADSASSHVLEVHDPPAPPAAVDAAESLDLWRHVQALPRQQRAVLVLRYYEDLTEAQTAQILGCSLGTVKSHTSRALAAMRLKMSEAPA
ncbi:SigE family RNA polymerase sigma factor [Intrasporangium sp.]|uniref:SigE family RNA polymerase sigma factor n=1 Tax=Intrasporangium sp. TaxID=1925024 RepID=UPI003365A221